jgi:hypothetical protein
MSLKSLLKSILREINPTNLNKVMDTFSKGMDEFSKSVESVTQELGPERKTNSNSSQDKKNIEKLIGKKKDIW